VLFVKVSTCPSTFTCVFKAWVSFKINFSGLGQALKKEERKKYTGVE
jgi:hypothetical protein